MLALPRFHARRLNLFGGAFDDRTLVDGAMEILEQVGLAARAWEKATSLSYGERRALEIGVALAAD